MDQNIYEEDFENSRVPSDPAAIQYTIDQIHEIHSAEYGWTCGEPIITPNSDGITVTIKIHLEQDKSKMRGRSM